MRDSPLANANNLGGKASLHGNYSPVLQPSDTVWLRRISVDTVAHWKSSAVEIQIRHLIRSGPSGRQKAFMGDVAICNDDDRLGLVRPAQFRGIDRKNAHLP